MTLTLRLKSKTQISNTYSKRILGLDRPYVDNSDFVWCERYLYGSQIQECEWVKEKTLMQLHLLPILWLWIMPEPLNPIQVERVWVNLGIMKNREMVA